MENQELNLATLVTVFADEHSAISFLETKRWPDGPICPFCGSDKIYSLKAKPESVKPVRAGVHKCATCRKQFTVRIGTVFEDSHIPLNKWLMAIHLMTSSKKGVSSLQLSRELGITEKSAWFLSHRIREAMAEEASKNLLCGTVEVDETYVGGKPRKDNNDFVPIFSLWSNSTLGLLCHWWMSNKSQEGRGTTTATAIVLFPTLDLKKLSADQLQIARNVFADLIEERFLPFDQIDEDTVRAKLDRRLLVDIIGLPSSICDVGGPIELLRKKLAAEPQIHANKQSRLVFTEDGEQNVPR